MASRNPFRGFVDFISETNRAKENWMTGARTVGADVSGDGSSTTLSAAWSPTTDIFTRGEDMVIRCDLAGVEREDLDITLSNGILTISGQRNVPTDEQDATFLVSERAYGRFRRSMSLPEGLGERDISAVFEEGVLEVALAGGSRLPSPRRIEINGSRA